MGMKVNCEGCAGCCIDWRPVSPAPSNHERRGPRELMSTVVSANSSPALRVSLLRRCLGGLPP